ncbi:MAG: secondary thiamine-phosphate synthase enzyme YjbQ [Deltaproteobacteria bacterium]|nr:secondary thiamine-phosphate synthase enzyme YjbQ [Deltaproteobacteria bacterium]
MEIIQINTNTRSELVDITRQVALTVKEKGLSDGIVVVYSPHTTAAITVNENADPAVQDDMIMKSEKLVERDDPAFRHAEGNSDGHLKSTLYGASETFIVQDGKLQLGTWQGIYFAEFDGPRTREVFIKVVGECA